MAGATGCYPVMRLVPSLESGRLSSTASVELIRARQSHSPPLLLAACFSRLVLAKKKLLRRCPCHSPRCRLVAPTASPFLLLAPTPAQPLRANGNNLTPQAPSAAGVKTTAQALHRRALATSCFYFYFYFRVYFLSQIGTHSLYMSWAPSRRLTLWLRGPRGY
jgi:hypothetical protein